MYMDLNGIFGCSDFYLCMIDVSQCVGGVMYMLVNGLLHVFGCSGVQPCIHVVWGAVSV